MNKLLNSGILRQNPVSGTIVFAVLYFGFSASIDWLFRWRMAEGSVPQLWTALLSLGAATLVSSIAVYLLLSFNRRQRQALEELNHSLRNSLQVLMYAAQQCDADTAPKAQEAIDSISDTLRDVTQRLGAMSERELRPSQRETDKPSSVR